MDRRNDPPSPPGRRDAWGRPRAAGPWSRDRQAPTDAAAVARPAAGPWGRWNRTAPAAQGATLATPFAWIGGSALLAGTTFLVSIIALVRAMIALVD